MPDNFQINYTIPLAESICQLPKLLVCAAATPQQKEGESNFRITFILLSQTVPKNLRKLPFKLHNCTINARQSNPMVTDKVIMIHLAFILYDPDTWCSFLHSGARLQPRPLSYSVIL